MLPEPAQESPSESGTATGVRTPFDRVRDVFAGLEKTLKVRRLYESGHKLRDQALQDLVERTTGALAAIGKFTIDVEPEALSLEGQTVLSDRRRDDAIPYKLFRDGVRSITIRPGIDAGEIRRLLGVLEARPEAPGHFDEDMATLLWREDFRFVEYVAIDEIGSGAESGGDDGSGPLAEMNAQIRDLVGAITCADVPDWTDRPGVKVAAERKEVYEMERRGLSDETADPDSTLPPPEEALARLRAEVEGSGVESLVHRVADILFDLFQGKECALELDDVRVLIGRFLRVALARGDLAALNHLLDRFLKRVTAGGPVEWLILGLLEDLASEEAMIDLRDAVRGEYVGGPEALTRLLSRLPAASLVHVARHVRELPPGPEQDAYHHQFRERGHQNPQATILYLRDGPADRILEAFDGLLEDGDETGMDEVVSDLLHHSDLAVRSRAVKAIEKVVAGKRPKLLGEALGDPEPRVRMAAMRGIERAGLRALMGQLTAMLGDGERTDEERERIIHAIAALGGPVAVATLREHLGPRKVAWLMSKKAVAARRTAILGLRDIDDDAVQAFLAEGCASKDKAFADACQAVRALSRTDRESGQ